MDGQNYIRERKMIKKVQNTVDAPYVYGYKCRGVYANSRF